MRGVVECMAVSVRVVGVASEVATSLAMEGEQAMGVVKVMAVSFRVGVVVVVSMAVVV